MPTDRESALELVDALIDDVTRHTSDLAETLGQDLRILEELHSIRTDLVGMAQDVRDTSADVRRESRAVRDQSVQAQSQAARLCAAAEALSGGLEEQRRLSAALRAAPDGRTGDAVLADGTA